MKAHQLVALLATASVVFAAGKGGGASGSPGGGQGHGFGNTPSAVPSTPRAERAEDEARGPRADKSAHTPRRIDGEPETTRSRSAAPAARDLSSAMHDINQAAFAQRRQLLESVDMRLKSSREAMKQIQSNAKDLRADARADFKAALDDVKAREKELNSAARASRNAKEPDWETSRGALARAYQNHADAMARLEAIPRPKP